MSLAKTVSKNRLLLVAILAYSAAFVINFSLGLNGLKTTGNYLVEMLQVLPAVFVLSALINVWVPKDVIMKNFGKTSGIRGKAMSILIGSVSAGPIYAAFPLAQSLFHKGASLSNIVLIISSWAVVKIPMLIVETKFLGISFAAARYVLTIPGILIIAYVCERVINESTLPDFEENASVEQLVEVLPGHNCGACGCIDCQGFARALLKGEVQPDRCTPGGKPVTQKLIERLTS